MRFEELISKYLDSELTSNEDIELRQYISDDPAKKVEFEEYIELSYILKKDSTFNMMSDEDESDIEDNLLMHIINEQSKVKVSSGFNSYNLSAVFSVVLIFFVSIYSVFDTNSGYNNLVSNEFRIAIPNIDLSDVYVNNVEVVKNEPKNNLINNEINVSNLILDENKSEDNFENRIVELNLANDNDINIQTQSSINNDYIKSELTDEKVSELFNKLNDEGVSKVSNSHLQQIEYNNLRLNYEKNDLKFNDLSFESIIFTDINRTGFSPSDNKVLNSYSQSVAFKLNEKAKVGIEIGRSQYEFTTLKSVIIAYQDLDGFNGSLDGSIRLPNGLQTKLNVTSNYNTFYANVFYDSKLFINDNFRLNGRLGVGVSNGGLLALGRLYADISIYGPLHITTGFDTRIFQNDNIYYNVGGQVNSSISFVNGLYFEF